MKLIIGFIAYGETAAKYLPYFLLSLKKQTFSDYKILVLDNSEVEDNEKKKYIKENYPEIDFEWASKNTGFAKGFNKLINKAKKYNPKYFMMLNVDIILESDMIEKMIKAMDSDMNLGSISPKIKSWDFKNNKKTNIIDSCGIIVKPGLKFIDVGQGQIDEGQFDQVKILGPSGTASIYRMSALEKVKTLSQPSPSEGEGDMYFDELMFMYKEDCDMAYRLFLTGFTSRLVNNAICYHDRTIKAKGESDLCVALNRKNKSKQSKKWSFLNQQIIFVKYWGLQTWRGKLAIAWHQCKILFFILLFEQYLFKELRELFKIRKKILKY